jgi:hypothetical protein
LSDTTPFTSIWDFYFSYLLHNARKLGPEILRRERIGVIALNVLLVLLRSIGSRNDAHFHGRDIITLLGDLRRIARAELNVPWKGNSRQAFEERRFAGTLVTDDDQLGKVTESRVSKVPSMVRETL